MAFRITTTREAEEQIDAPTARERRTLESAIFARRCDHPTVPTRAVKRLRRNPVAEFEPRVGDLRAV